MNIILFGLPRSGKTTIGQKLAVNLSLSFIDTDRIIEKLYQKRFKSPYSCREIYQKFGEKKFRILESEAIFSLQNQSNTVIALGGGLFVMQKLSVSYRS
ncbi:MAG: shikimate kinase [Chlamydiales bacterium]